MLAGCGGGDPQDKDEPLASFRVQVERADFPEEQKLAKRSKLEIAVRNVDTKAIPNVAVTLNGFDRRRNDPDLADPRRPQFVINGRSFRPGGILDAQEAGPPGGETAYVNTWTLGKVDPGELAVFRWDVTAVEAGSYRVSYSVAAGVHGKAKAVDEEGRTPAGIFAGVVSNRAPRARIAEDGYTVLKD